MRDHKKLESQRTIHEHGVTYVHDLLYRVGFTIHDVNRDPDHHYQIFAQFKDRAMLIAVRTAYHPDVGKMDVPTREKLIHESKKLNAVPHFAGLSLTVANKSDIQREDSNQIAENNIVFYGISVVR